MKNLVLLGSTGSIGTQTLDVAAAAGYRPLAMAVGSRIDVFEQQLRRFQPPYAAVYDTAAAADLRVRVADLPIKVLAGMDGLCTLAALPEADLVLNAVVGMVGDLAASAIKRNKGIKDYGKLIPGHGGIMDRFDSVIVTAPFIYSLIAVLR